ncbi:MULTISPECIES: hypothetical protein [Massilia]|uniref:Flp family type IVb pilin n=2 Tax=Massilia TaxID=149698 RepID=A0ABX0LTS9_9BURK|nr:MULTISPECIES: hypothetical protein [Massilia]NHZ35287.1 hypothetical protein [Massilia rubra]NHZ61886.1 hypothetical protein [Massilia genomosp. 1]NHZ98387.1 hypothetical protein [Massilia sp. CCM 8734]
MRRHQSTSTAAPPPGTRQRGQAMIEYLVVTSTVALVLFIPTALTNDMSLADYLARAVRAFFRSYSFMMSVS